MPTNRKRKPRTMKPSILSPAWRDFFQTGNYLAEGEDKLEIFMAYNNQEKTAAAWEIYREEVMKDWLKNHPCSRPWVWWEIDAPKEEVPGWSGDHFNSAQRRRIGGTGTPSHEVTVEWGGFEYGIPESWVNKFQEEYYNGRQKDIHGNPIGTEYKEGDFKGKAIDPNDPPLYESEAAYLERHSLLTDGEKKFLEKHCELLEPEKVTFGQ